MDIDRPKFMEYFLEFSAVVTGFSQFELQGTGQATLYFDTIRGVIGSDIFGDLLQTFHKLDKKAKKQEDSSILIKGLNSEIMASGKLGPVAKNIVKLWYIATWEELPDAWHEQFGATINDSTFIASPQAYPEGLVWRAVGVNPPGAKAPGYGTWSEPPLVSLS